MTESELVRALLLESSRLGVTLFRNNQGRFQDNAGHWVNYGLAVGSPDLVGWMPVTITERYLGRVLPVFTAIEAKTETGRLSPHQRAFLQALAQAGAVCGVARSVEDLHAICGGVDTRKQTDP